MSKCTTLRSVSPSWRLWERRFLIGLIVSSRSLIVVVVVVVVVVVLRIPESALIGATFASDLPFLWYRWRCLTKRAWKAILFSMLLGDSLSSSSSSSSHRVIARPPSLSFLRSTPLLFSLVSKYAPRSLCSESPRARVRGKEGVCDDQKLWRHTFSFFAFCDEKHLTKRRLPFFLVTRGSVYDTRGLIENLVIFGIVGAIRTTQWLYSTHEERINREVEHIRSALTRLENTRKDYRFSLVRGSVERRCGGE